MAFILGLACAGYGCAWLKADACRAAVAEELSRKPVFGRDMLGNRVRVSPTEVSVRVTGPLQVEVSYMVPYDLHGSIHIQRFKVLPWSVKRSSSQVIDLV
ncbi:hypothetical protein H1235_10210 [Pseudoxanthomonas sp. NC8]|nr:hypothetical protein H1235_10210 [Pseudoxanthomonas sp. NC8]